MSHSTLYVILETVFSANQLTGAKVGIPDQSRASKTNIITIK